MDKLLTREYTSPVKKKNIVVLLGIILVILVFLAAIFSFIDEFFFESQLITAVLHNPHQMNALLQNNPPSFEHPLGTDQLGRDVLARIIYGTRISVQVGLMAVFLSGIIGTVIGLLTGYFGGIFDDIIMRVVDILLAFPGIIIAIAAAGFLGPSLTNIVIALSLKAWVNYARLMRGSVLKAKNNEYIEAAEALGARRARILFHHLLPNTIAPIIIQATMGLGSMIVAEAGLSFLGLGPQPPTPSWGMMLALGRTHLTTSWWLAIFPGIAIFLTVMGFNFIGDAVRDSLDPRTLS